jgi:hypothetical protein
MGTDLGGTHVWQVPGEGVFASQRTRRGGRLLAVSLGNLPVRAPGRHSGLLLLRGGRGRQQTLLAAHLPPMQGILGLLGQGPGVLGP